MIISREVFARFCFNLVCLFSIHQTQGEGASLSSTVWTWQWILLWVSQSRFVTHCQCHRSRQLSTEILSRPASAFYCHWKGFLSKSLFSLPRLYSRLKGAQGYLTHSENWRYWAVTRVTWEIIAFKSGKYQHLCTFVLTYLPPILQSAEANSSK